MQEYRMYYWDNLKMGLMLLVVVTHFWNTGYLPTAIMYYFVYLFHMPLFIFVSGVFHKNVCVRQRIAGLLSVGITYNILLFVLDHILFGHDTSFYILGPTKIPWFVFCIAICCVTTYFLRECNPAIVFLVSITVGCFVGYDSAISKMLPVANAAIWFPCYYLGYILGKDRILSVIKNTFVKYLGGGIFFFCVIGVWLLRDTQFSILNYIQFIDGSTPYSEMFCKGGAMGRIFYYCIMTVLAFGFMCLIPNRKIKIFTEAGSKTMQIYFWHIPIRSLVFNTSLYDYINNLTGMGVIIYTLIIVTMAFGLALPYFKFPTKQLMEGPYWQRK